MPPESMIVACDEGPFHFPLTTAAAEPDHGKGHALPPPIPGTLPGWTHFVARDGRPVLQGVLEDFAQVPGFLGPR